MSKSSSPLALSVVTLTEPDDVEITFRRMTAFDDRKFGFNHSKTLGAMGIALRGTFKPDAVVASYGDVHPRVLQCIKALFTLGQELQLETRLLADYPDAGLRSVERIEWGPEVSVNVRATCWYVANGKANIPLLQPRKDGLSQEKVGVYLQLGRQAFCKGDWSDAILNLVDLSGDDPISCARLVHSDEVPEASDELVRSYVETFVAAKARASASRQEKAKEAEAKKTPIEELLGQLEQQGK